MDLMNNVSRNNVKLNRNIMQHLFVFRFIALKPVEKFALPLEALEKPLKALVKVVRSVRKSRSKFRSRTFKAFAKVVRFAF